MNGVNSCIFAILVGFDLPLIDTFATWQDFYKEQLKKLFPHRVILFKIANYFILNQIII